MDRCRVWFDLLACYAKERLRAVKMRSSIHLLLGSDHIELDELLHATFAAIECEDEVKTFRHLDLFWARLAMHIRAEHLWLFPAFCDTTNGPLPDAGEISALLQVLRDDHNFFMRELARAVKAMRLAFDIGNKVETLVVVREILGDIAARLMIHDRMEEEKLYPFANEKFLGPGRMDTLFSSIKTELDNYPERFADGPQT